MRTQHLPSWQRCSFDKGIRGQSGTQPSSRERETANASLRCATVFGYRLSSHLDYVALIQVTRKQAVVDILVVVALSLGVSRQILDCANIQNIFSAY